MNVVFWMLMHVSDMRIEFTEGFKSRLFVTLLKPTKVLWWFSFFWCHYHLCHVWLFLSGLQKLSYPGKDHHEVHQVHCVLSRCRYCCCCCCYCYCPVHCFQDFLRAVYFYRSLKLNDFFMNSQSHRMPKVCESLKIHVEFPHVLFPHVSHIHWRKVRKSRYHVLIREHLPM